MRRSDRQIKEFDEIVEVLRKCQVCRLAMQGEEYPYIVPLNFGMEAKDGRIVLYFHGALTGRKYDLMERNPKVCFEAECTGGLHTDEATGNCTMAYESVIGYGQVEAVCEEEKYDALMQLMRHYHREEFAFNKALMPNTRVWKLTVESCTGKRRAVLGSETII